MAKPFRYLSSLTVTSSYLLLSGLMIGFSAPAFCVSDPHVSKPPAQTLGWLEKVRFDSFSQPIEAKIDSGADHSSLHATGITQFDLHGQTWVRFTTVKQTVLIRPLVRTALIKQKRTHSQPRPVVEIRLCLNGRLIKIPVNLVDRSAFKQPMLIGRSALWRGLLIDPNQTHLTRPDCLFQSQANH
ncbi:MAG: RimK/LysX family protein [Thiomicrorhabdus chilensis]|uniref:ATP-dependent zinc protease family protein n=1 Tax=Thiomicrorhabdus chilensis TaxID=63656 RepID=UPI00299D76B6|nr:RimK/LysX family protein [Thiomicrorhabdus chilensis]MDX1348555.1 RimK/LysX family protein [Thiomicrorhabdus chilensis]